MADRVQVDFGANTTEINNNIRAAGQVVKDFQDRVRDLNDQLRAVDAAKFQDSMKGAASGASETAKAMDGVRVGTAGATREFIVLGHEVVSGNFARIPGSLIVLAERMGSLQSIIAALTPATLGWAAAIGATVVGLYEWASASIDLERAQNQLRGALELNGQSSSYNAETLAKEVSVLKEFAGVSTSTAQEIAVSFGRAGGMSEDLREKLVKMVGDFAAATHTEAPEAAKELIKMFDDPQKGAEELSRMFKNVLTPAEVENIRVLETQGKVTEAQIEMFKALSGAIDGFREKTLDPLTKAWENLFKFRPITGLIGSEFEEGPRDPNKDKAELGKGGANTTGSDDALSVDALTEKRRQQTAVLAEGYRILQQGHYLDQEIEASQNKQLALQQAINAARARGDTVGAQKFSQALNREKENEQKLRDRDAPDEPKVDEKAIREEVERQREKIATEIDLERGKYQQLKDMDAEKVAAGEIDKFTEIADLQKALDAELAAEMALLEKEKAIRNQTPVELQRIKDEELKIQAKYNDSVLKLEAENAKELARIRQEEVEDRKKGLVEQQKETQQVAKSIQSTFDQMVSGILQGTQTWNQAMGRLFENLAIKFVDDTVVKMLSGWLAGEATKLGITKLYNSLINSDDAASATAGAATNAAKNVATVNADAALTFAGVMANLAPLLGPAATGPATAAAAQVYAVAPAASFAVGAWNLGSDMVAQLHQGEMVIPKTFAQSLRENNGGGFGGGGDTYQVTLQISAIDTQTGAQFIRNNGSALAQELARQMRNANPKLRK